MKQIETKDYGKLIEPLKNVTINHLFARSIIERHVSGKVYMDNPEDPRTFYIVHPYGMSLLFGDCNNAEFNQSLLEYSLNIRNERSRYEWMQAFPDKWDMVLADLFSKYLIASADNTKNTEHKVIELNTRVNFKFNQQKYMALKQQNSIPGINIVRSEKQIYDDMKGTVVPSAFWDSAEDFIEKGIGFSLFYDGKLASTAYSAFVIDDKIELGIETFEEFKGKGLAHLVCSALIDYCINHAYEPIWACKAENTGSYKLALKLGFEPTLKIPYYRLSC